MSQKIEKKSLALFFTAGVSLKIWVDVGNFDREKRIYEEYISQGVFGEIHWFTYGDDDEALAEKLHKEQKLSPKIQVHTFPEQYKKLGVLGYSLILPFVYREILKNIDIYKTNQMSGSWVAAFAARLYSKPLFLRTGYTWSLFASRQGKGPVKQFFIKLVEQVGYKQATIASVSSQADKEYIRSEYHVPDTKISVVSNYVDVERFEYKKRTGRNKRVVTVTRFSNQKNLFNIITAVAQAGVGLDIYHSNDSMLQDLQQHADALGANVEFKGAVKHEDLPKVLQSYTYFVLGSLYEGMPKALIEAMATGCVCLGTNVVGIKEIIKDSETGILAKGADILSLEEGFERLFDADVQFISKHASEYVRDHFSFDTVAKRDIELIKNI